MLENTAAFAQFQIWLSNLFISQVRLCSGSCNEPLRPLSQSRSAASRRPLPLGANAGLANCQAVGLSGGEAGTDVSASPGLAAQTSGPPTSHEYLLE